MFAKPRPKKSILPPPTKKRKATPAVAEINFDFDARHEYLTGFHKRKQQRIKHAQEEAARKVRQERIETRKLAREDRKREVEEHVKAVKKMLETSGAIDPNEDEEESPEYESDEWDGFPDRPNNELVDQEEEYIDEDRYTTVTVESVSVSRDGLEKPSIRQDSDDSDGDDNTDKGEDGEDTSKSKVSSTKPKKKKKKFRYENKFERQITDKKQRASKRRR